MTTKDPTEVSLHSAPWWLVDWINTTRDAQNRHSLSLTTSDREPPLLTQELTCYLNEYDTDCPCNWRAFDREMLLSLLNDQSSRRIVLATEGEPDESAFPEADLERVAHRLMSLGSVILHTHHFDLATPHPPNTFQISLYRGEFPSGLTCHMSLDLGRFSPDCLASIIADSFLCWRSQHTRSAPGTPEEHENENA